MGIHTEYIHIPDAKFFKEVLESYTTSGHSRIHEKPFPNIPSTTLINDLGSSIDYNIFNMYYILQSRKSKQMWAK